MLSTLSVPLTLERSMGTTVDEDDVVIVMSKVSLPVRPAIGSPRTAEALAPSKYGTVFSSGVGSSRLLVWVSFFMP